MHYFSFFLYLFTIIIFSVPDDPREWKDITVRNAVLELLREMSQSKLAKLCPLSQVIVFSLTVCYL